jgi:putative endonuclease
MTNDLVRRVFEHRTEAVPGFSERHGVKQLVYFEQHATAEAAIAREKKVKRWRRNWKLALIEKANPDWRDLAGDFGLGAGSSPA